MSPKASFGQILYYLCIILLLMALGIQVNQQVIKFFNRDTTVATSFIDEEGGLSYPLITTCPGFNISYLRRLGWPMMLHDENFNWTEDSTTDTYPKTLEEAEWYWTNATFKFEDFFTSVIQVHENRSRFPITNILTRDSNSGRCYTIQVLEKVKRKSQFLKLVVDFSNLAFEYLPLNLHSHEMRLGLYYSNWLIQPTPTRISQDVNKDIRLRLKRQSKSDDVITQGEYLACSDQAAQRLFLTGLDMFLPHMEPMCQNFTLCYFPSLQALLLGSDHSDLPYCGTARQLYCLDQYVGAVVSHVFDKGVDHICPRPGIITSYEVSNTDDLAIQPQERQGKAYVLFEDLRVMRETEYILMDFSGIVGTVGGAMGMFIGISCLDLIKWMLERAGKILK